MKKFFGLLSVLFFILSLVGCNGASDNSENAILYPDPSRIRSICSLATVECYFHNVAKSETKGVFNISATKKTFWIEYTGTVKIGIDFSRVNCEISDDIVTITLPNATVLGIGLDKDSYTEDSYFSEKDSILTGKITADEQTAAINEAQKKMRETAEKDEALLLTAKQRAKEMIENYIEQISIFSGKEYQIKWVDAPQMED